MLAVETVAAGGGSLCEFDGQKLVVGPRSTGAMPGPACYGHGGPLAVTDMNLFLGRLEGAHFPFELDRGVVERELDNRTSLIVDPPNGRIPPVTEEARERRRSQPRPTGGRADSHERRSMLDRCISYGVPNLLAGYNSYFQIFQSADNVVVMQELIHDVRVIPIDDSPHLDATVRQLHGDSRGHWDGDTLVVETTNYSRRGAYRGATENVRVIERFTRVAPDIVEYVVTFDDPDTWARPWTLMIPLKGSEESIFEYACHEGNYAIAGILSGARAEEAVAEQP